jgi:hypothetical protein
VVYLTLRDACTGVVYFVLQGDSLKHADVTVARSKNVVVSKWLGKLYCALRGAPTVVYPHLSTVSLLHDRGDCRNTAVPVERDAEAEERACNRAVQRALEDSENEGRVRIDSFDDWGTMNCQHVININVAPFFFDADVVRRSNRKHGGVIKSRGFVLVPITGPMRLFGKALERVFFDPSRSGLYSVMNHLYFPCADCCASSAEHAQPREAVMKPFCVVPPLLWNGLDEHAKEQTLLLDALDSEHKAKLDADARAERAEQDAERNEKAKRAANARARRAEQDAEENAKAKKAANARARRASKEAEANAKAKKAADARARRAKGEAEANAKAKKAANARARRARQEAEDEERAKKAANARARRARRAKTETEEALEVCENKRAKSRKKSCN